MKIFVSPFSVPETTIKYHILPPPADYIWFIFLVPCDTSEESAHYHFVSKTLSLVHHLMQQQYVTLS